MDSKQQLARKNSIKRRKTEIIRLQACRDIQIFHQMATSPEQFTRALADPTRLRTLMLLETREELCVCDFTEALLLPQPKISRHLAILRDKGVVLDRRAGLWIHYRIHPDLPNWALEAIKALARGCVGKQPFVEDRKRLARLECRTTNACD